MDSLEKTKNAGDSGIDAQLAEKFPAPLLVGGPTGADGGWTGAIGDSFGKRDSWNKLAHQAGSEFGRQLTKEGDRTEALEQARAWLKAFQTANVE